MIMLGILALLVILFGFYPAPLMETLNARPTRIKTIANTAPVFSLPSSLAIKSKLVEPVNPYNKEQPYSNKPDDKALNTKYFIPDSDDLRLSLSIEAKIYSDNDCNSKPK